MKYTDKDITIGFTFKAGTESWIVTEENETTVTITEIDNKCAPLNNYSKSTIIGGLNHEQNSWKEIKSPIYEIY